MNAYVTLNYLTVDDAQWAEPIIASYWDNLAEQNSTVDKVRAGIAFAAAYLWRYSEYRPKATKLLVRLAGAHSPKQSDSVYPLPSFNDWNNATASFPGVPSRH